MGHNFRKECRYNTDTPTENAPWLIHNENMQEAIEIVTQKYVAKPHNPSTHTPASNKTRLVKGNTEKAAHSLIIDYHVLILNKYKCL